MNSTTSISHEVESTVQRCINSFAWKPDADLLTHLRRALTSKIEGIAPTEIQNTYLKSFDIPHIRLFDILANSFPLVVEAQKLVAKCIMEVASQQQLCIIDLGIGRSVQMERMLKALDHCTTLETVTVIGIELQKDSLDFSSSLLNDMKNSFHFDLVFHPINAAIEDLDVDVVAAMVPSNCILVANASLALHHIQTKAARVKIFKEISSLQPDLFTLIEPNVDCFTDNFELRLFNAYEHFGALYAYINTLALSDEEKKGLKQFFSNELFDAIAVPNEYRFEKYDLSINWCTLGKSFGLSGFNIEHLIAGAAIPRIKISNNYNGFVNLSFGQTDILGIIALEAVDTHL